MFAAETRHNPRLGLYAAGTYPAPQWGYRRRNLCGMPRRMNRRLGDASGGWVVPSDIAPAPPIPGSVAAQQFYGVTTQTNAQDAGAGTVSSLLYSPVSVPGTTAATLLAAANLPGAPSVVKQAAAQIQSSNPVSSFLEGTILGLPTYMVLGGGLLAIALVASAGKKR